jgi:hypothetical protein
MSEAIEDRIERAEDRIEHVVGQFAAFAGLVGILSDPKMFDAQMADFRRRLASAKQGEAELVARRKQLDEHERTKRADIERESAALAERSGAAFDGDQDYRKRLAKHRALVNAWKICDEDEEVARGFRDPIVPPLEKARRAHGGAPSREPAVEFIETAAADPSRSARIASRRGLSRRSL